MEQQERETEVAWFGMCALPPALFSAWMQSQEEIEQAIRMAMYPASSPPRPARASIFIGRAALRCGSAELLASAYRQDVKEKR